jgi:hypothetical protein
MFRLASVLFVENMKRKEISEFRANKFVGRTRTYGKSSGVNESLCFPARSRNETPKYLVEKPIVCVTERSTECQNERWKENVDILFIYQRIAHYLCCS